MSSKILVLNGSPSGKAGNCAQFLKKFWPREVPIEIIHLKDQKKESLVFEKILQAPAVVFVTGTYWDSWGSPLQKFFESWTPFEGHPLLMGKPAACLVLMHSVGGKSVLSRLQGVLNTFGFLIPPMGGMVYSLVNQLSSQAKSSHADDFWQPSDLVRIVRNLQAASSASAMMSWQAWPVDHSSPKRVWIKGK